MKRLMILLLFAVFAVAPFAFSQNTLQRPALTRLSHVAYYTKDLDNTLRFFKDFMGYDEMTRINDKEGNLWIVIIKINDDQFVEIMPEKKAEQTRLAHFAFETEDVEAMRLYLGSKGIKVPDKTNYDPILGTTNFFVSAPHGKQYEFVQVDDKGIIARDKGKHLPATRISDDMSHVALATPDLDEANAFYEEILGYYETWRGGSREGVIQWVYSQIPDGKHSIEFLLYDKPQSDNQVTGMNHICLEVDDVVALHSLLKQRPLPEGCRGPSDVIIGTNNIRQLSLNNIDGIRIEIMENHTVDGLPPTAQTGTPLKYVP